MEQEKTSTESSMHKSKISIDFPKILAGLFIGLLLGIPTTFIITKNYFASNTPEQSKMIKENVETEREAISKDTSDTLISKHYLTTDSKIFENTRLGYKIDYPRGVTQVYDCPGTPCALISDFSIRMEPLIFYGKEEILGDDLYCSADGPQGSVRCDNPKISEYTNSLGVKGFLVERLKIRETRELEGYEVINTKTEQYDDAVYVFPINKTSNYKAVLLSTDLPNDKNLEELEKIANSFRLAD